MPEDCQFKLISPTCLEYYPTNDPNATSRFPDTGKQCFFKESIYPLKPWPRGCKIYQAGDVCNTYEISDEGNYVFSCDVAMKTGQCVP